jgi:hypothetical protein
VETHKERQTCAHEIDAPQLSSIEIDQDMADDTKTMDPQETVEASTAPLRSTATIEMDEKEEWPLQ